jgi:hypothetical protein
MEVVKEYYSNGKIRSETTFVNGVMNGECSLYSEKGVLYTKAFYKDGLLDEFNALVNLENCSPPFDKGIFVKFVIVKFVVFVL